MRFWLSVVFVEDNFDSCLLILLMFEIIVGVFGGNLLVLYSFDIFELKFSIFDFSELKLVKFEFVLVILVCVWFY